MNKNTRRGLAMLLCMILIFSTLSTAMAATLQGGPTKGKAARISIGVEYVGKLSNIKKTVWYKFKATSSEGFYTVTVKNLNVPNVISAFLMDANEEELDHKTYYGKNDSFVSNQKLKKNRWYYIRVDNFYTGSGNIKVSVKFTKDGEGDTLKKAKTIQKGKPYIGSLDVKKDVDYLVFKAPKTGYYTFTIKNINVNTTMNSYILDKYEEELSSKTYYSKNNSHVATLRLKKGQYYYIRINSISGTGKYKVTID